MTSHELKLVKDLDRHIQALVNHNYGSHFEEVLLDLIKAVNYLILYKEKWKKKGGKVP